MAKARGVYRDLNSRRGQSTLLTEQSDRVEGDTRTKLACDPAYMTLSKELLTAK